jgi:hypothetical protein
MAGPGGKIVLVNDKGDVMPPRPDWTLKPWFFGFAFTDDAHARRAQVLLDSVELHMRNADVFYEHVITGAETARFGAYQALYDAQAELELMFAQEVFAGSLKAGRGYEVDYKRLKLLKALHPNYFPDIKAAPAPTAKPPSLPPPGGVQPPRAFGPNHVRNVEWKRQKKALKLGAVRVNKPVPVPESTPATAKKS